MFGPFYPAPLQEVVNHAERLVNLLRAGRLVSAPLDEWAAAWMSGREGEIERFLELTLSGRAQGKVDDATAAAILAGYLASLHEGMARRLGLHRAPCCGAGANETTAPPRPAADPMSRAARSVDDLLANLVEAGTEPGAGRGGGRRAR